MYAIKENIYSPLIFLKVIHRDFRKTLSFVMYNNDIHL